MRNLKIQKVTIVLCIAVSSNLGFSDAKKSNTPKPDAEKTTSFKLLKDDLVIQGVNSEGETSLYKVNVLSPTPQASLIVKGGHSAHWSVNRRKLSFFKKNELYILDLPSTINNWDSDRVRRRFSHKSLSESKLYWDRSGKLNFFSYSQAYGISLNRSIGLKETVIVKPERTGLRGFHDLINPILNDEKMSILNVAFSDNESSMFAQICPAVPISSFSDRARIVKFETFYGLSKTDREKWFEAVKNNQKGFVFSDVGTQIYADKQQVIGSPGVNDFDTNPILSLGSTFLAFNRTNRVTKTTIPLIVNVSEPSKTQRIEILEPSQESKFFPALIAGGDSYFVEKWAENTHNLWLSSSLNEKIYYASRDTNRWRAKLVCGIYLNRGAFNLKAFHENWFAGVYSDKPSQIYLLDARKGEESVKVINLAGISEIQDLCW